VLGTVGIIFLVCFFSPDLCRSSSLSCRRCGENHLVGFRLSCRFRFVPSSSLHSFRSHELALDFWIHIPGVGVIGGGFFSLVAPTFRKLTDFPREGGRSHRLGGHTKPILRGSTYFFPRRPGASPDTNHLAEIKRALDSTQRDAPTARAG
jgi:hypothetical protein